MKKNIIVFLILLIVVTVKSSPPDNKIIEVEVEKEVCRELFVIEDLDSLMLKQIDDIVEHKYPCYNPEPGYYYVLDMIYAGQNKLVIHVSFEWPNTIEIDKHIGSFIFNNKQYILRSGYCGVVTEEKEKLCFIKKGIEVNGRFFTGKSHGSFCAWTLLYDYDTGEARVIGTEYTIPSPDKCSPCCQ